MAEGDFVPRFWQPMACETRARKVANALGRSELMPQERALLEGWGLGSDEDRD